MDYSEFYHLSSKKIFIILILIIMGCVFLYSEYEKQEEIKEFNTDFIAKIENSIIPNLEYYSSYSLSGQYESELVISCMDEFDNLTDQKKYDYLNSCIEFCDIYGNYRDKMDYPITTATLGKVTVKTSTNVYSLSSIKTFSKNGVNDYELGNQNKKADSAISDLDYYSLTKGVNGRYTYRCTKICSDKCGNACNTCIMNGKSFNKSPKCTFDYGASSEIGWIGCPDCGDVSSEKWFDWYKKALGLSK